MRLHSGRPGREDVDIGTTLFHKSELVGLYPLPNFVITDIRLVGRWRGPDPPAALFERCENPNVLEERWFGGRGNL